jgi:outer membrane protein assembly factor BamB
MAPGRARRLAWACIALVGLSTAADARDRAEPRRPREDRPAWVVAPPPPWSPTWRTAAPAAEDPDVGSPYPGTWSAPPYEQWRVHLPGGPSRSAAHSERTRPVLLDGSLFVGASDGDALYELDRRNGTTLRRFPAAASVESEPVVGMDFVVFADTGGHVWCYGRDGALRWSFDAAVPVLIRPTVQGGVVYVNTVQDLLVALDLTTGEQRWRYQHRTDISRKTELALYAAPSVVLYEDTVLAGFSDGALVGLSRSRGDIAWQVRVGEGDYPDLVAPPTVSADGIAFVSGYFNPLLALDLSTMRRRWAAPHGAASAAALMRFDGRPVLVHPGTDGKLRALDAASGEVIWTWSSETDGALTMPVWTDAGILVGSGSGTLVLVDPATGAERWRYAPPFVVEGVASAPAVDGRQAVFVTQAGYLVSLLAPDETPIRDGEASWELTRSTQAPRLGGATSKLGGRAQPIQRPDNADDDAGTTTPGPLDPLNPLDPDAPPQPGDVESPR